MKKLFFIALGVVSILSGCSPAAVDDTTANDHGDVMVQLVSYSNELELFAEAAPLVVDQPSAVIAHFTFLKDFTPLEGGKVTLSLIVGSKGIRQLMEAPLRKGIYAFEITPVVAGKGKLVFDISTESGEYSIVHENVEVFTDAHDAIHTAETQEITDPGAIIFTKEQSWKVDFSTEEVKQGDFGQIIRTTAMLRPAQDDKVSIVARTSGIVNFSGDNIFEGTAVSSGKPLFRVSGASFAGDNSYVRYVEAENNYKEASANYERKKALAEDKIVTEAELLKAMRDYETARVIYESLKENFDGGEQVVKSPVNGFIEHIYVQNGEYVEAGSKLLDVAKNKRLLLLADVQQKYAEALPHIRSANIRNIPENKTYSLDELNGELSSYGRSANKENYLIPVRFEIDNTGNLFPGSFVELYIICHKDDSVLTVSNDAILEEQGKYFVLVQLTPEQFLKREVIKGVSDGKCSEIISGLEAGERVVSRGAILVKLSQASGALDPHAGHVH